MVSILTWIVLVGILLFLINSYVPMAAPIKTILNIVVILALCIYLLKVFGIANVALPKLQ